MSDAIPAPPSPGQQQTVAPDVSYGSVGSIPQLPNVNSLADVEDGVYLGWGSVIDYDFDTGMALNAVLGPPGTPQDAVRVHGGKCLKTVAAVGICIGKRPDMPHWDTGQAQGNDVLLRMKVVNFSAGKLPDGTPFYGQLVLYFYGCQASPLPAGPLDVPSSPLDANPSSYYRLDPNGFLRSLIGPAASVSTAAQLLQVTW